jgi:UDP-N-acetylmuramoylalanine--D-glutamate ligase
MNELNERTVLVLGLGQSGLAMARWCARCGARVRVWDTREAPPNADALAVQVPGATLLRGALTADAFAGATLVLRSPGLSPHDERLAAPLAQAAAAGLPVQGELDLFMRALADLKNERGYAPAIVAITGTNGKTTTTAMAALLIARAGRRVAAAGNIGPTMLQTLADTLDQETTSAPPGASHLPEVWVLELSSFQLHGVAGFEPSAAAVLNLTQDHLDWHGSMQAYIAAKARVFGTRAVMVINRDDPWVEALVPPPVVRPAGKGRAAKRVERRVVRFGLTPPTQAGDYGLVIEGGMAWLVRALETDATLKRVRASQFGATADGPQELHLQRLMPADALRVRGRHNAANALAALALATAIGCPLAPMLHGLREYRGEPHRVEHVATLGGVDAFDDSKGTNVGATVAALDGLGADKAPGKLLVILGGDGKGQDFAPLVEPVRRHVRAVATLGRDAALIEQTLAPSGVLVQRHATLEEATRWCFAQARGGDAVLLSPACASLDMFRNYAHRADVFVQEVHALAASTGGVAA